MKYIIILLTFVVTCGFSCTKTADTHKLSYNVPGIWQTAASYWPTTNVLTSDEEACMLEEFKATILAFQPNAFGFTIEQVSTDDWDASGEYHCP